MLIGIDGNEANIENKVGVGQYAHHLLLNLYKIDNKNKYIIYLKNPPLKDLPKETPNWQYRVFGPSKLWTKFALPIYLYTQKEKLDLFYSPSHYSPQFSPFPTIPTIHDLGYLQYQNQFNKKDLYQLINWTRSSIKKATHIIAVSNFTKQEIIKTYNIPPEKISIAYNGVEEPPKITPQQSEDILKKFKISKPACRQARPYFLYLGTLKPNKNIPFLIKSFSLFLKKTSLFKGGCPTAAGQVGLVIAGKKGWLFDEIFKTVTDLKLENKVIFTDYINNIEKWTLYKNAISLVIPSTYEGFGIPAIEAMKVGTPVIASNIKPFQEVIGKSGLIIDPTNNQDLVDKMTQICDPKTQEKYSKLGQIQASKFTWENTAKSVINVFENLKTTL